MSVDQAANTSIRDYEVMTEAFSKKEQRQMLNNKFLESFNAWQNAQIQATDKKGKRIIKKFSQLYDYKKDLERSREDKEEVKKDYSFLEKLAEINKEGGEKNGRL